MDSSSRLGAVESCDVDSWGGGGWRTKSLILHFFMTGTREFRPKGEIGGIDSLDLKLASGECN